MEILNADEPGGPNVTKTEVTLVSGFSASHSAGEGAALFNGKTRFSRKSFRWEIKYKETPRGVCVG